jgi:hypothetical protein
MDVYNRLFIIIIIHLSPYYRDYTLWLQRKRRKIEKYTTVRINDVSDHLALVTAIYWNAQT